MKIIIDCDSGNDDAWAIISLLKAEEKCDYQVVAITHVDGNTTPDNSALNTLLVLKSLNRLDVPVNFVNLKHEANHQFYYFIRFTKEQNQV